MAKNPFRGQRLANRAQARILRRDTNADFRVTQQGLDSILANLATTQTGLGKKLTRVNARSLAAMERISDNSARRMDQVQSVGRNIIDKRYGSAIAGNPELFRGTDRVAQASGKVNAGELRGGELQMRGANEAMDILAAAGETAASSGQYELAMALRERQGLDAETIAASRLALQQQKADAEANERYLRLQTRLQSGGSGGAGLEGALAEVGALAESGALTDADISRLALQYNLGPEALAQLKSVASQYGTQAGAAGSPGAQAYTESEGLSPSAYLPADKEASLNQDTWRAYDPKRETPAPEEALRIAGLVPDSSGKYTDGAGNEIPEEEVAAVIAYIQSTWMRIAAGRGK